MSVNPRRFRWLAVIFVLWALIALAHRPILRSIAEVLIVDERVENPDAVLVVGGDGRYRIAVREFEQHGAKPIVRTEGETRLIACGILPPEHEIALRELIEDGVAEDAIVLLPEDPHGSTTPYVSLRRFLAGKPDLVVVVLVNRFYGRHMRRVLDVALADSASQVFVRGLPDRRYDESNWWRSRRGAKSLMNAYLSLGYLLISGSRITPYEDTWDPDEYERELRRSTGSAL